MRKLVCFILLVGVCLAVGKGWYWVRNGYSPERMYGWTQGLEKVWWSEEADAIMTQDFRYLGRGRQAFAFESMDGKYVLKFPRGDIYKIPFWLKTLPLKARRARQLSRRAERERDILESFQLAMEELKESTASIAMNCACSSSRDRFFPPFFKANGEQKTVRVIDKIGRSFHIPLGDTYFILQKKKQLFQDVVVQANALEGMAGVEKVLDALFQVIVKRTEKGILNRDGSFLRNYGFDEEGAYQTDVGSFYKVEVVSRKEVYLRSMELSVKPIRRWMKEMHPEWLEILDRLVERAIEAANREPLDRGISADFS
jgi:hypothetical protein